MNDAAPNHTDSAGATDSATSLTPLLHPAPGRCIVRIVPRLLQARTEAGIEVEFDGRYEHQPMLGALQEIGDPTTERERVIAEWAKNEASVGHYFVFSMYGAGSPYWNDEMRKMLPVGYDFRWLQGLRLFDIGQLSATVDGTGPFGEQVKAPLRLADMVAVQ